MAGTAATESAARSARGAGLSTQAIVESAMTVADEDGLEAVSIRRVAALLGVRPMSLYTHIASKDELLDLMTNELVGLLVVEPPPSGGWRSELSAIARRSHEVFVAHPWVLAAFVRRPRPGPNTARHAKQMARAVAGLKLEPNDTWTLLAIVDDFVLGHALRSATRANARAIDASLTQADLAEMPELEALPDVIEARYSDDKFEIGLQTVLDGVERRFAKSGDADASSPSPQPA